MKKITTLVLLVILAFTLFSCSGTEAPSSSPIDQTAQMPAPVRSPSDQTAQLPQNTAVAAAYLDVLTALKAKYDDESLEYSLRLALPNVMFADICGDETPEMLVWENEMTELGWRYYRPRDMLAVYTYDEGVKRLCRIDIYPDSANGPWQDTVYVYLMKNGDLLTEIDAIINTDAGHGNALNRFSLVNGEYILTESFSFATYGSFHTSVSKTEILHNGETISESEFAKLKDTALRDISFRLMGKAYVSDALTAGELGYYYAVRLLNELLGSSSAAP
jgi:hypothetical protein